MKKHVYTYFIGLFSLLSVTGLIAQDRYTAEIFSEVQVQEDVVYGQNISIISGMAAPMDLLADVYTGVGDTETNRPVVLVAHTGSFLPPLLNGQTTGDRGDSAVVEICTRLAKRGFVAIAYTYRLGWAPLSTNQFVRTGSLLQAAYRGIQDTRTAIRYVRKTVAEDGNPLGADSSKIVVWGLGTGGYLAVGAATLDDYEEVTLDKFLDPNNNPLADTSQLGDFYGTSEAPLSIPNHVGYSSDFHLSVNMGGAMGDLSWLDGKDNEPPMIGVHCPSDEFAPYYIGNVVVPTTDELVIEDAAGTRAFVEQANIYGNNNVFGNLTVEQNPLIARIEVQKGISYAIPDSTIALGADNMYAFIRPGDEGSPWDWWDPATIRLKVEALEQLGIMLDADRILAGSMASNPDMSAEKGRRYIDTTFQLAIPRMCLALDLGCNLDTHTDDLKPLEVGLQMGPVPARDYVDFRTNSSFPIQAAQVFDMQGRALLMQRDIQSSAYTLRLDGVSPGSYIVRLQFEEGIVTTRLVVQ